MTKADIVGKIFEATDMSKSEAAEAVEAVFNLMKTTLESGESLKLSGFGNFLVKQKADRQGRNPQTGEKITITARQVLSFKPSKLLRDEISR
jgi:integration host factor subunit alpha